MPATPVVARPPAVLHPPVRAGQRSIKRALVQIRGGYGATDQGGKMINTLHKWGIKSNLMYTAGIGSVGLAFTAWAASNRLENAGLERADRWGIFIGEWAPTFFAMGLALRMEETRDEYKKQAAEHRARTEEKAATSRAAAMR